MHLQEHNAIVSKHEVLLYKNLQLRYVLNRNDSEETNVNGEVSSTNKSPTNQKKSTTHKTKRRVRAFTESDEEVEEDEKNADAEEPNEEAGESVGKEWPYEDGFFKCG